MQAARLTFSSIRFSIKGTVPRKSAVSKYLSEIGKKGGKKSGQARMAKLTPAQRSEVARTAAAARWGKKPDGPRGK
jgi:hypothetical protein